MLIKKIIGVLSSLAFVLAAGLTSVQAAEVQMSFFGNQHFRFVSNEGKVILINPWVKGNKDAGVTVESFKKGSVDLILTTSGHGDDQGQAVEIAARTGATIFTVAELGSWMQSQIEQYGGSKKQVYRGAIGGRTKVGGVSVQLIHSIHGSGTNRTEGFRRIISAHFAQSGCEDRWKGKDEISTRPWIPVRGAGAEGASAGA